MSDFIAGAVSVTLLVQSATFALWCVQDSIMQRRLRRIAGELVSLRAAVARAGSSFATTNGAGGDAK